MPYLFYYSVITVHFGPGTIVWRVVEVHAPVAVLVMVVQPVLEVVVPYSTVLKCVVGIISTCF